MPSSPEHKDVACHERGTVVARFLPPSWDAVAAYSRALAVDVIAVGKIASMLAEATEIGHQRYGLQGPPPLPGRGPARSPAEGRSWCSLPAAPRQPERRTDKHRRSHHRSGPVDPVGTDLERILRALKPSGLKDTLPERLVTARTNKLGYAAILELLLSDELKP